MKTIAQIAKEIGVSRQAVYRRLSAIPSEMLSTNDKGVQVISADGESLLKELLSDELSANSMERVSDNITEKKIIDNLKSEIQNLREENSKLTSALIEQSTKLLSLTEKAQKIAENAQTLHAMENIPQLAEQKKAGFFKRIFTKHGQ